MQKQNAFTIVELLIVIVVVAILAAVTVGSFAGVRDKSVNSRLTSAANAFYKAFITYKQEYGTYPTTQVASTINNACLGSSYPAKGVFAVDACYRFASGSDWKVNTTVNTAIGNYLTNAPDIADILTPDGDTRGMSYSCPSNGSGCQIYFRMYGRQTCARGTTAQGPDGSYTACIVSLP